VSTRLAAASVVAAIACVACGGSSGTSVTSTPPSPAVSDEVAIYALRACVADLAAGGMTLTDAQTYESSKFQIRGLSVSSTSNQQLSPADTANGIESEVLVEISFLLRRPDGSGGWGEWQNELASLTLGKVNGAWERHNTGLGPHWIDLETPGDTTFAGNSCMPGV
jgi:hypothetical protein